MLMRVIIFLSLGLINNFFVASLQGRLDAIDVEKAVEFVANCMNFDGGFGSKPGSESHAGLIYCCLGLLSITGY